eukprot:4473635-Amphidinium_carterae.3
MLPWSEEVVDGVVPAALRQHRDGPNGHVQTMGIQDIQPWHNSCCGRWCQKQAADEQPKI